MFLSSAAAFVQKQKIAARKPSVVFIQSSFTRGNSVPTGSYASDTVWIRVQVTTTWDCNIRIL